MPGPRAQGMLKGFDRDFTPRVGGKPIDRSPTLKALDGKFKDLATEIVAVAPDDRRTHHVLRRLLEAKLFFSAVIG